MPRKIRELIKNLKKAGFVDRGSKGSHRNFVYPDLAELIPISGKLGENAKVYQEKVVQQAIEEVK